MPLAQETLVLIFRFHVELRLGNPTKKSACLERRFDLASGFLFYPNYVSQLCDKNLLNLCSFRGAYM
jgi:hypothetical protein